MRARFSGNKVKIKEDNQLEELFNTIDTAERRLWIHVILKAVEDLLDDAEEKDYPNKKQKANYFLLNKDGALQSICEYLDVNMNVIIRAVKKGLNVTQGIYTR